MLNSEFASKQGCLKGFFFGSEKALRSYTSKVAVSELTLEPGFSFFTSVFGTKRGCVVFCVQLYTTGKEGCAVDFVAGVCIGQVSFFR